MVGAVKVSLVQSDAFAQQLAEESGLFEVEELATGRELAFGVTLTHGGHVQGGQHGSAGRS